LDLRNLPDGLSPADRCDERRRRIERELGTPLEAARADGARIGQAEEKNCEQMFGHVPLPIGLAGPLAVSLSSGERIEAYVPLATTEGALVASVNRGCKALSESRGASVTSIHHGTSRSLAFRVNNTDGVRSFMAFLSEKENEWKAVATATSGHLSILSYAIDASSNHVFLTISCDTGEAMGMNMVTIAAQAIGEWVLNHTKENVEFTTVAGNVDSDKKPSARTREHGRGYAVTASATIPAEVIASVLKSTPEAMVLTAQAKLEHGSKIAGAIGANLHAANVVAAVYLATGQDVAHVVEGSLADTTVEPEGNGIRISVRLPALLVGIRGGGTGLPAQNQCLNVLLQPKTSLPPRAQLAETIAAAVLAGELSLLAAQASHTLASSHKKMAR